ncbi:putative zinc finger, C2H2 type [Lyophyllum shimeji]|uniref:Zinc finger, C2H2 type n=1 Tax=Lyophyllum shimeji TaxID=47721 RepID=A0A9P3PKL5_LYOSH|nr:putative zinc finger, C2H2 type [Lyophyllum shimeji]
MASRSSNSQLRRDDERPTLPPIRDLFHDLRTPHESPSLTLARLRVSDDYVGPSSYISTGPSTAPGPFRPPIQQHSGSQTPQLPESDPHYRYRDSPPTSLLNRRHEYRESARQSSEPRLGYAPTRRDPRCASTCESSPHVDEPRGLPAYARPEWSATRHASHGIHISSSSSYQDDAKSAQHHSLEDRTPIARYPPYSQAGRSPAAGYPAWPAEISTTGPVMAGTVGERTPIARQSGVVSPAIPPPSWKAPEDANSGSALSKYECSYCGKGFNRPSSLKIHLNSHTGAKPFVCPVESCSRSFSVLSNMRRHARVHTQTPLQQADPSSEEESERSTSLTGSAPPSAVRSGSRHSETDDGRRRSTASISSAGSRKSLASEDEITADNARPEKRSRRHPK